MKTTLREFGGMMEELFRLWRAVPPIVDDDFEEALFNFRQHLERCNNVLAAEPAKPSGTVSVTTMLVPCDAAPQIRDILLGCIAMHSERETELAAFGPVPDSLTFDHLVVSAVGNAAVDLRAWLLSRGDLGKPN